LNGKLKEHIRNIMTLRYDPVEKPYIKLSKYKQWIPAIYETTAITLERKLMAAIGGLEPFNRVGIALSSGIDSVLLLYLIRHVFPNKEIIAFHYNNSGEELEDAELYANDAGARFVVINNRTILNTLQWQVSIIGEPIWDAFDYILYETAKHMRCDIMVDGSGADELFGGYTFRYNSFAPANNTTEGRFYAYMDAHNRDWVEDQAHLFGPEIPFDWNMIKENIIDSFGNPLTPIGQIFLADYNGKLAHLFTKKQAKFQNVYGLPIYSPYLHPHVAEYGMRLEPSLKIMGQVGKIPLRQIAARYDVVATPKKIGFTHDTVAEWNNEESQKEALEDLMNPESQMFSQGLISYDWVTRHVKSEKDSQDVRYVNKYFQLLALEQYLRKRMHMDYL